MAKQVMNQLLNMEATQDSFFADAAMIGIGTALPAYTFCWTLNNYFDVSFARDPEQNISLKRKGKLYDFPVYCYYLPNSNHKYLLYKLKNGNESLLPETRQLDYLWLIQTAEPEHDALLILSELKRMNEVQLSQMLTAGQLKNMENLLV